MKVILMLFEFCTMVPLFSVGYVLSRFNQLEKYSELLVSKHDFKSTYVSLNERQAFCQKLREAHLFEMKNEATGTAIENFHSSGNPHLGETQLHNEKKLIKNYSRLIQFLKENGDTVDLFIFPCSLYENNINNAGWLVAYNIVLETGIVFTNVAPDTEQVTPDNVMAVIDKDVGATLADRDFYIAIQNVFLRSSIIDTVPEVGDQLCSIRDDLQFRICSICADAMHHYNNNNKETSTSDDHYNFYYKQDSFDKTCPKLTVTVSAILKKENKVENKFLYCDMSIRGVAYKFYLSRDITGMYIHGGIENIVSVIMENNDKFEVNYSMRLNLSTKLDEFKALYEDNNSN